jgi:hypothetical protein
MALRDLMWGCPLCGREGRLRSRLRTTHCEACGATFRRGEGATIVGRPAGGVEEVGSAAAWLDRTPAAAPPAPDHSLGPERAFLRLAEAPIAVRPHGDFVGWGERFGPKRHGLASLTPTDLVFRQGDGTTHRWPLDRITAVQPTGNSLQVKVRDQPVAYFRFFESSVRRWEHWIHHRLRHLHRQAGRGEIVEFQPRISTR